MTLLKRLQRLPPVTLSLIIAFFYALIAHASLELAVNGTNASPIWPASGLAFIAVWYLGYNVGPGIWLGAFAANLIFFMSHGWTWGPALLVAALTGVGNSTEALFGVFLLRNFTEETYQLSKIRDIFKFVFASLVACLPSATIGTSVVYFIHPAANFPFDMIWLVWWLGDVIGILVIASTFLTFHRKLWYITSRQNILEFILVSLVLIGINTGVFMGTFPEYGFYTHVTYLILPVAIWSTYRFGFPGATLSIIITSIIAVFGSILHLGPFIGQQVPENLVIVGCFLGVISVTTMTLGAALYERQITEERIKHNEARYRSVVENSFDGISIVDGEAKYLYSSPAVKRILGYDPKELLGQSLFDYIHPEDLPSVIQIFQGLVQNPGGQASAVCRVKHKDGRWPWLEGTGHNLLNDPTVAAVVINYRDITERKLYQERFEKVVEYSPVANVMVNSGGHILLVNKTAEILFGFNREELLNMKIETLVPEQFRKKHPEYRSDFNRAPQARPMGPERELYALRKDGGQVPVEIGLTPIEIEGGFCVLASIVDITQRRRAEEILKRDKESLERMVDERSKELIKTQKELKQFSRLADIGTLAATVAHELRNPLGVIHLAAYNLKNEKADLNTNKHLVNIEKKVWEGNQIIDNLLSYARIKIPNYEEVRILSILDECVSTCQGRFAEKSITIGKDYDKSLDLIEADPLQIREIFINILNNACQAIMAPQGRVELRALRKGDMLQVSIQDDGAGIAPEDLDKIFEPFFTRKSKGTGLGLTICNELVNLYQGKIEIDSRLGQGTTVSIFLPLHRRDHA